MWPSSIRGCELAINQRLNVIEHDDEPVRCVLRSTGNRRFADNIDPDETVVLTRSTLFHIQSWNFSYTHIMNRQIVKSAHGNYPLRYGAEGINPFTP